MDGQWGKSTGEIVAQLIIVCWSSKDYRLVLKQCSGVVCMFFVTTITTKAWSP